MSRNKIFIPVLAIFCLLLMVVWLAGGFQNKLAPGNKSELPAYQGARYTVQKSLIAMIEQVPASVVAKENTLVSSRLLAELKTLNVRAGDKVTAGQLIATLDDAELKAELQRVAAQQAANSAKLEQATKQLVRNKSLNEKGLIAINQVDEWQATVNELQAQDKALQEAYRSAEVALGYTQITAPISGKMVARLQEPGSMVSPGGAIISLFNPLQLQIEAPIRESQVKHIQLGSEIKVRIPALDISQTARVSEMVPIADSQARSFIIKLDMPLLKNVVPGMYALVELVLGEQAVIQIPTNMISKYGQLAMVEVIESGQLHKRYLRLGEETGNKTIVISGLNEGDQLAVQR
ncbi:efflux transporter periplasmic adaptor subunit [Pseudoalteromonas sp. GCY]|uniref:efflux RND transporter periplasmic adaptor subunit n=1 Tax=Pseudoalteromonas sp. GCY TaxID=2003316 RepID=UPI000BFED7E5|nr:efflux RND transporter periplasmic adaptor subunit [Pseudoalteromonas sp. GCY]PHI36052.1 efflux transporter periplasmic adaptor subunit [Pseudoalteromonas sp. GCY]QQQ67082.1 efflux RND transporter periplasmic adaptor subunit [Pseudoalteromonas sp. GCY]